MRNALSLAGYFGWLLLMLVPNESWRLFIVTIIAPVWSVFFLTLRR